MQRLVDQLEAGYRVILGLYEQLLALASSMEGHLKEGNWEAVDQKLCAKELIMGKIDGREHDLGELRERLQCELGLETFALSAVAERLPITDLSKTIDELMDILMRLQEQERVNEELLRSVVENMQGQLEDFQKSRRAAKAYQPSPTVYGDPRFVDEKK
ncbi:MAG: flagellar protein FlgN [Firmicutes bacterium]|nr:flagellar protein FlgN [Bacillota bacterium]